LHLGARFWNDYAEMRRRKLNVPIGAKIEVLWELDDGSLDGGVQRYKTLKLERWVVVNFVQVFSMKLRKTTRRHSTPFFFSTNLHCAA